MDWQDVLIKARLIVRKKSPYYTETLLSLAPYPTLEVKTMGVTKGLVLVLNPDWVGALQPEKCAGVLVHEIHHVSRKHHKRTELLRERYAHIPNIQELLNIAADMPINVDVREEKWDLPDGAFFPSDFKFPNGLTLEEYFKLLLELGENLKQNPKYKSQADKSPDGMFVGEVAAGKCGSIAGNSLGEIEDKVSGGRSSMEVELIANQQLKELEQAYKAGGRGSLPQDLKEAVTIEGKSKMPYHRLLAKYVMDNIAIYERGFESFSRKMPSRKSYVTGVVRAGLIEGTPEVAVVVDTSGSMGKKQLSACLRETAAVMRQCDIEHVWFIEADTRVSAPPKRLRAQELTKLELRGRGGTDFTAALQALEQLKPKPNIAIYYTDGDGAASYRPRGIDVIWGVVESGWKRAPEASFGKVVFIPD